MSKVEEFIAESKLSDLLKRNEDEKQKNTVIWVLAIIGAVAAVAGIAELIKKRTEYRRDAQCTLPLLLRKQENFLKT